LVDGPGDHPGLRPFLQASRLMVAHLSSLESAAVAEMWDFRARAEGATAAQYQSLARRLRAGGAAATVVERVAAAASDEVRHGALCAQMAAHFGHPPDSITPPGVPRVAPHDLEDGARLAYEMVALFCVSESINATLLLRSWQKAEHPETRALLHRLLADEVEHSRIGWAYASALPAWRNDIAVRLPVILAATTHDEPFLDDPSARAPSRVLAAHGLLSQGELRDVFREAMEDVILPGLDHCGIETTEARRWLQRCTSPWKAPTEGSSEGPDRG
jgi:hypothetical protein